MSENLKRAESLFNRIMNQTNDSASVLNKTPPQKLNIEKTIENTLIQVKKTDHVLPYCWTIWYHSRNKKPKEEEDSNNIVDSYLQTTTELNFIDFNGNNLKNFASLEQLLLILSNIKKTFDLSIGTEFLIFKTGINPVWEDPINAKGGRWIFRFNRNSVEDPIQSRKRVCIIWERLVLKTLTGSLIPDIYSSDIQSLLNTDICGLVLSIRKDEDILSIWNANIPSSKKTANIKSRRILVDSILRIIREADAILSGDESIVYTDNGSTQRVKNVSFEYRIHSDNENTSSHHHNRKCVNKYRNNNNHIKTESIKESK
ncbi:unnamed protein product [Candida verbasci]|uniref:Uncharacterized protein n=1 Tax=Candida verbasci TaxID=1227364 RepID=A0A9W4TYE0_9ASCO|nr:unnamed protein product [Candida verbasci]